MMLVKLWRTPHPFIFNRNSILIPGVVTFFLIIVFTPFGLDELPFLYRLGMATLLGSIAAFSVFAVVRVLQKLKSQWISEEGWTIGKEFVLILGVIVTISLTVFCTFAAFRFLEPDSFQDLLQVFIKTLLFSFLPLLILILYEQNHHQKQKLREAAQLNALLQAGKGNQEATSPISAAKLLILKAENGKPILQVAPEEVLFLQADGNYVDVFHLGPEGGVQKTLIRNRLKKLMETLPEQYFFHCHKSYAVNMQQVLQVSGNARNLELLLRKTDLKVPVSRAKSAQVIGYLAKGH